MTTISNVSQGASSLLKETSKAGGEGSGAFKALMNDMFESTKGESVKIEKSTHAQIMGDTDFTKLTTNMLQLETMVQGMTGLRDKLVGAWQDLQKLQI